MATTIYNGNDTTLTFTVYTDATLTTPINLTGITAATFLLKTKLTDQDAAAIVTKKLGSGVTVTNAAGGVLTVTLAAADTVAYQTMAVFASLKIKDSSSKTATVYSGTIVMQQAAVQVAA